MGPEEKMICTYAESALALGWALALTLRAAVGRYRSAVGCGKPNDGDDLSRRSRTGGQMGRVLRRFMTLLGTLPPQVYSLPYEQLTCHCRLHL